MDGLTIMTQYVDAPETGKTLAGLMTLGDAFQGAAAQVTPWRSSDPGLLDRDLMAAAGDLLQSEAWEAQDLLTLASMALNAAVSTVDTDAGQRVALLAGMVGSVRDELGT